MADPARFRAATLVLLGALRELSTRVGSAAGSAVRRAYRRGTARAGAGPGRGIRSHKRVRLGAHGLGVRGLLAARVRLGARVRPAARGLADVASLVVVAALLLGGPAGNRSRLRRTPLARHSRTTRAIGTPGLVAAGVLVVGLIGAVSVVATAGPTVPAHSVLADSLGYRQLAADRANRDARPAPATTAPAGPVLPTVTPDWVSPMPGVALTSCFGPRWGTVHQGIDFGGAAGTPILAAAAGTIFAAGWTYAGYGISIVIDHGNGLYSHYAHAEQALVAVGQHVVAGQPIALEGTTGDSTGPHLHFEIHEGLWNQVDPAPFLRSRGVSVDC